MTLSVSSTPKTLASPARPSEHCSICEEMWHPRYAHYDARTATWHVPSSGRHGEGYYLLHWTPRRYECECPHAVYRHNTRCAHGKLVDTLEAEGRLRDIPEVLHIQYEQERWQRLDAELSASCGQV